jgi:hypothetical protein
MLHELVLLLASCLAPQDEVERATLRGVHYLLQQQLPDGSWPLPGHEKFSHAGAAFLGFALIRAGLPREHLAIQRVDALLRKHAPRSTYDAACRAHFLDAASPLDQRERLQRAAEALPVPRADYYGYGYVPTIPHGDLSNHQFALLGWEILERHELGPGREAWEQFSEFLVEQQKEHGGFGYFPRQASTPTMDLAGLACLAACHAGLLQSDGNRRVIQAVEVAIHRGFDHVGGSWYLDQPRERAPLRRWVHYAGATLERAASLTGRQEIGGREWYGQLSQFLLAEQKAHGGWSSEQGEPVINTGLALATLARATAATGPSQARPWEARWNGGSDQIRLTVSGRETWTAFVSFLAPETEQEMGAWTATEWHVDGVPLGRSTQARGALQFPALPNGSHRIEATLLGASRDGEDAPEVRGSLELTVSGLVDAQASRELQRTALALLPPTDIRFEATRAIGGDPAAGWCWDGSMGTSWRWRPAEGEDPRWLADWDRSLRTGSIILRLQTRTTDGQSSASPTDPWLELRLNRKRLRLEPDKQGDALVYALPRPIRLRSLELRVLDLSAATKLGVIGIREVQLLGP